KLFEHTQYFNHSWDTLTAANWRKYPNELSSHVISVDILSREVDPQTGVLRTERLLCCKQNAPQILRTLGLPIPEVAYFREISELDPNVKEYTANTFNLSLKNIMSVHETVIFREGVSSSEATELFVQQARFQACGFVSLARILEEAAASRFKANASTGKKALDIVIEKILEEARAMEGKAQAVVDGFNELTSKKSSPAS
ncbi:PRELI-like family-domain-containing protein, partial [Chytridium lagenaria]